MYDGDSEDFPRALAHGGHLRVDELGRWRVGDGIPVGWVTVGEVRVRPVGAIDLARDALGEHFELVLRVRLVLDVAELRIPVGTTVIHNG